MRAPHRRLKKAHEHIYNSLFDLSDMGNQDTFMEQLTKQQRDDLSDATTLLEDVVEILERFMNSIPGS